LDEDKPIEIYNAFIWAKHWWQRRCGVLYIDTPDYKADNILERYGVRIKYLNDYASPESYYIIVSAKIPENELEAFLSAMDDLQKLMLISGHLDYEKFCRKIRHWIEEDMSDDRQ